MSDLAASETVGVTATVLHLRRAGAGRLLALAEVEIEVAGVAFRIHGVRVIKTGPRSKGVAAPCCRIANGRLAAAITLPPELAAAIAQAVLDEYEATMRAPPAPGASMARVPGDALRRGKPQPNVRDQASQELWP